jgi:exosortase C (VPDSG-CTERM-specific)
MNLERNPLARSALLLTLLVVGTAAIYALPLAALVRLARSSNLYSHILLIPFISAYLAYTSKARGFPATGRALKPALACYLAAGALAAWALASNAATVAPQNRTVLFALSFVTALQGHVLFSLGGQAYRSLLGPCLFLFFMTPLTTGAEASLNAFLQHGTVPMLDALLKLSGTTFFREGTSFEMPGLSVNVAPECSGIRSTLVLIITTALGGYLFLRTPALRTLLVLLAIPIGLFRNALRIFTLCMLTLHVDSSIIEGPVHSQGGPPFFLVSLVILLAVLLILRRIEHGTRRPRETKHA